MLLVYVYYLSRIHPVFSKSYDKIAYYNSLTDQLTLHFLGGHWLHLGWAIHILKLDIIKKGLGPQYIKSTD